MWRAKLVTTMYYTELKLVSLYCILFAGSKVFIPTNASFADSLLSPPPRCNEVERWFTGGQNRICVPALYIQQHLPDPYDIYTCQVLYICSFDFVFFWLGI